MDEDIRDEMDEVADEATPETDVQAVEQRTDDYEALARRIDDVLERVDRVLEAMGRIEAMTGAFVEAGATVTETETIDELEPEPIGEEPDGYIDIDELDLS